MVIPDQTSWTLIRQTAAGIATARTEFTDCFVPLIRRQLKRRWRGTPLNDCLDDATQDVLLACFRKDGAVTRAAADTPPSFRGYLFGVVRNIARRFETHHVQERDSLEPCAELDELPAGTTTVGRVHDRAAAREVLRRATARYREQSHDSGQGAKRRFDLLQLRFEAGLAIREIAEQWGEAPETVHQEYRRARREFRASLDAELAATTQGDLRRLRQDLVQALQS